MTNPIPAAASAAADALLTNPMLAGIDLTGWTYTIAVVALEAAAPHIAAAVLTAARDDLAATARKLETRVASNTELGTAAGLRLAAFRLTELADHAAPATAPGGTP